MNVGRSVVVVERVAVPVIADIIMIEIVQY